MNTTTDYDRMSRTFWVRCNDCREVAAGLAGLSLVHEWRTAHVCLAPTA